MNCFVSRMTTRDAVISVITLDIGSAMTAYASDVLLLLPTFCCVAFLIRESFHMRLANDIPKAVVANRCRPEMWSNNVRLNSTSAVEGVAVGISLCVREVSGAAGMHTYTGREAEALGGHDAG